ncbi:hypothetical protein HYY69_03645 [Candidatus Woesearchaeota archaeon]|nr:hypothetical protein [Candidatus Woesearchaeota archaeon]
MLKEFIRQTMKAIESKQSISKYIRIIIVITVILFSLFVLIYKLDTNYRQKHEAELTVIETYYTFDGWGKNYTYLDTPYTKFVSVIYLSYLIVPFLSVIAGGIIFIFQSPTWKNFFRSLLIPSTFVVLTFVLQIIVIYLEEERLTTDLGVITLMLSFAYTIISFILFSVINSIIVYNQTHKTKNKNKKVKR